MKFLTSYKREGDNAHDDAPDSMTILAEFVATLGLNVKKTKRKVGRGYICPDVYTLKEKVYG